MWNCGVRKGNAKKISRKVVESAEVIINHKKPPHLLSFFFLDSERGCLLQDNQLELIKLVFHSRDDLRLQK